MTQPSENLQQKSGHRYPAVEPTQGDVSVAPSIARPAFFILAVLFVILAIVQLGGRILFANLERFEPRINAALAERGVVFSDLSGDWRFFNPVLRVGAGEAPGVQLGPSWAEIDTLESLARNRIVLRNAEVTNLRVTLIEDETGTWSLEGRRPIQAKFDWQSLLWHSDQLRLEASVVLRGFEIPSSELTLGARLTNFGGRHRGDVRLANSIPCERDLGSKDFSQIAEDELTEPCTLRGRYNVEEAALWLRRRSGGAVLNTKRFALQDSAAALAGLASLEVGELDARMRLLDDRFSGPVNLLDTVMQLPGGEPVGVNMLAEGWSADDGHEAMLELSTLQLGPLVGPEDPPNDSVLEVNDARMNWTLASGAVLKVPQMRVDDVTSVVGHMLSPDIPVALWIERLSMRGSFTQMFASWSADAGLGFGGDFSDVSMQNFRGVPKVNDLTGSFTGGTGFLQLRMLDSPAIVGLPELYRKDRVYESVSGQILLYFGQDYFGMKGTNLQFRDSVATTSGSFSLVSTKPLINNQVTLALSSNAGEFADIAPYIPYKLPQNVLNWIAESGLEAKLEAPRFVMHGPLREEESDIQRSYLIDAEMHDGALAFNPDWPRITKAEGAIRVSHTSINAQLDRAEVDGIALRDMTIRLPAGSASVAAKGTAIFDASVGLNFIRTTPLKASMDFVADDWWGEGQMSLYLDLDVPLDDRPAGELDERVKVEVNGQLENTTFGLPEADLVFASLRGPIEYSYPYALSGQDIAGRLFGKPVQLNLSSHPVGTTPAGKPKRFTPRRIDFAMTGPMHSDDMWPLLNMEPSDVVDGLFDFSAVYSTETDTGAPPVLVVNTDFSGAQIKLPAPLGKRADEDAITQATVVFDEPLTRANLDYRGLLNTEIGIGEEGIIGGDLHLLNARRESSRPVPKSPARWDGKAGPITIDGDLDFADIAEWSSIGSEDEGGEGEDSRVVDLPPYKLADVKIARALLGDFEISDVRVSGESDDSLLRLEFDSETVAGEIRVPDEGVTELTLARFAYVNQDSESSQAEPATKVANNLEGDVSLLNEEDSSASLFAGSVSEPRPPEPSVDPLTPELMSSLKDMNVNIESVSIDGEDFGSWKFDIRSTSKGITFQPLVANLQGLKIQSDEGVRWTRKDNRTAFKGTVAADDVGEVLKGFGYARSVETESMLTTAAVSWPGSPLNCELFGLRGEIDTRVKEGRFLDVSGSGNALRLFSLLNFSAFEKRMSLNFKDVFGRGISFEKIKASMEVDEGRLRFTEPMRIDATGGDFKVNGEIDLRERTLDNEMVVTLPVNKSLPWLGAYLALANPVVGISVLLGERIFRKPIKGLSSAKYKITGSFDDPDLELVSIFDRSMDKGSKKEEVEEIEVPDDLPEIADILDELPPANIDAKSTGATDNREGDGSESAPAAESASDH